MATAKADLAGASEFADLERLWQSLDLPGYRVELIDGQIVVSPTASRGHSNAVTELIDQLAEVKPRAYARGGVPLSVLVDRLDEPPAVTLFSQPGAEGYARRQTAAAGQPRRLPEPFGIALDTARLLG
jgi:hypothetical protein